MQSFINRFSMLHIRVFFLLFPSLLPFPSFIAENFNQNIDFRFITNASVDLCWITVGSFVYANCRTKKFSCQCWLLPQHDDLKYFNILVEQLHIIYSSTNAINDSSISASFTPYRLEYGHTKNDIRKENGGQMRGWEERRWWQYIDSHWQLIWKRHAYCISSLRCHTCNVIRHT